MLTPAGDDLAYQPAEGLTPSERYLAAICRRNFLSLWSHPRPFRDQAGGKELCDLLVVLGDDIIIFSDKHCALSPVSVDATTWQRWFRSAVAGAARQAWGAERWLRRFPERVFADEACSTRLPVNIPPPEDARFHLVVTVHGIASASRAVLGGSGSLILDTSVQGLTAHTEPFVIGDLDPTKTFVHVLDDTTLDVIMTELDTTADFVRYLREKERVCRSRPVFAAGEENLLAFYLTHIEERGEHAIVAPGTDMIGFDDSHWVEFERSSERRAKLNHDEVSYRWDALIERFAHHALTGTQYSATEPALPSSEIVLRFLAAEPRLRRRSLADALVTAVQTTAPKQRRLRVIPSLGPQEPMYVFLIFPWLNDKSEADNRRFRLAYLQSCMSVAKMKHPAALDVVGIATEAGAHLRHEHSEDALYLDARSWSADDEERAREDQQQLRILLNEQAFSMRVEEYPATTSPASKRVQQARYRRNEPCYCGSGQKFKRCHGA